VRSTSEDDETRPFAGGRVGVCDVADRRQAARHQFWREEVAVYRMPRR